MRGARELGMHAPDLAATFVTDAGALGTLLGTAGVPWESALYELQVNSNAVAFECKTLTAISR